MDHVRKLLKLVIFTILFLNFISGSILEKRLLFDYDELSCYDCLEDSPDYYFCNTQN